MLVTPFDQTDAFKLGIIDSKGKTLRKTNKLTTTQERDAFSFLHRLTFNMKKIINRLPGGENRLKSLVAALWLVREYYESGNRSTSLMQEKFVSTMKLLDNRVSLVEEEILVKNFLAEEAPVNSTGSAVSTDEPKIGSKDIKKYKQGQGTTITGMVRRKPLGVK
jgi:hypothetical protein